MFCVFMGILLSVGPPGAWPFCFAFLPAAFGNRRSPTAPSFVARRKIGEKGVPRGCGPLNPRGNVLGHSDVLCANRSATVRVTRLSRLRRCRLSPCLCVLRVPSKNERFTQPPNFRLQIKLVILSVPTNSPQLEQYNRDRGNSVLAHATGGPKSR